MDNARLKQQTPLSLSQRLFRRWYADEDFGELFDEIMSHPRFDDIFGRTMELVPEDRRLEFLSDMFMAAGNVFLTCRRKKGGQFITHFSLFTMVVHGIEAELQTLVSTPELGELAGIFHDSGYAHENAEIMLCPILIEPIAACDVGPDRIRCLVNAAIEEVSSRGAHETDGSGGLFTEEVRAVFNPGRQETSTSPEVARVVTRLLVGVRLLPHFDTCEGDVFGSMKEIHERESFDDEADDRFQAQLDSVVDRTGAFLDGPFDWSEGLGAMAVSHLVVGLGIGAAFSGYNQDRADAIHISLGSGDGDLHIALVYDGEVIGPINLPTMLAMYGMDEIVEWASEAATELVMHDDNDDLSSLLAANTYH